MAGERDGLLADAFHQVAVGGEHVGLVIDDRVAELGSQCFSAIAMPTAVARPWPSGPVVVSTPGVMKFSGWPGVFEPSWRKRLISSRRHRRIAGEIEQRIDQHRAVARREHETVAIGPVRVAGVEFEKLREQHRGDVGGAHRQAGMARLRLLDGVHCQGTQGVCHLLMGHGGGSFVAVCGRHGGRRQGL